MISYALWVLRISVFMQCIGHAAWFYKVQESPLMSMLWGQPDMGGFALSESTALIIQQIFGGLLALAGFVCLVRPHRIASWFVIVSQLFVTITMSHMLDGFLPSPAWVPPSIAAFFPFATQAGRIVAPIGLLLLWPKRDPEQERKDEPAEFDNKQLDLKLGIAVLRIGIALTFISHGIEAVQHAPKFIDMLIVSFDRILEIDLPQSTAEMMLTAIGWIDIAVGVLVVAGRFRSVVLYMAFWGLITAFARVTTFGVERGWIPMAIRFAHFGVPLAIWFLWQAKHENPVISESSPKSNQR